MGDVVLFLDLPSRTIQSLEELAVIQGTSMADAMANAIGETLLRERILYGVFAATVPDYGGLVPDGSVRLRPCQEAI